jgi:cyclopropane fatty-acyl-phospholipid synthase-like methyltransferase
MCLDRWTLSQRFFPAEKNLLVNILQLNEHDIFLDFGHGIGNICIQAAYTIGCEARGIELVQERNLISKKVLAEMSNLNTTRMNEDKMVS